MASRRRGFTLIELLVVMGVILALIAILLPATGRVWDAANTTKCQSNVRTLTHAFLAFASDNDGHLPGSKDCAFTQQDPNHQDWLFGPYSILEYQGTNPGTGLQYTIMDRLAFAPQSGTIWKYISNGDSSGNFSRSRAIYLCPSLMYSQAGSGIGSNGKFDYAAFSIFSGAPLKDVNTVSDMHFPLDPNNPMLVAATTAPWSTYGFSTQVEKRPTPLICQEDPQFNINSNLEGQHANTDQISHVHNGGSYYGSVDGGVYFVSEPDTNLSNWGHLGTWLWSQNGPQSQMPIGLTSDPGWGAWSHD